MEWHKRGRTKIICTIGPSVETYDMLKQLVINGMDVARLNFSHGSHEEHLHRINLIKQVRKDLQKPVAIMLDTKGPEVRIGKMEGGEATLAAGQRWILQKQDMLGNSERATVRPDVVFSHIKEGMTVLFDNGYIASKVIENRGDEIEVEIINGGIIKSVKSVNIPLTSLDLPILSDRDIADLKFGCENDIDLIAVSFTRSAEDILAIRTLLSQLNKSHVQLIAKIENHQGITNLDTILQAADGLMVARGDLGVEVPMTQVPKLQKMMLRKCTMAGKPGITATQMLESMIKNPRPTRAEASDVANAIYDATSAVMLSGETAMGDYPIECVSVMENIALETEGDFDYDNFFALHASKTQNDIASAVTGATIKTAYSLNAKAIFAFTSSGITARLLSRLKPKIPIIAMTSSERCYHQMSVLWGVVPILSAPCSNFSSAYDRISSIALEMGLVSFGDLVVVTAGAPFGVSGTTNAIVVQNIGDILVRGVKGLGEKAFGRIKRLMTTEGVTPYSCRGRVIVVPRWDDAFKPYAVEATAVILQNLPDDDESEVRWLEYCTEAKKTCVTGALDHMNQLKDESFVTVDPAKAVIYREK